MRTYTTVQGDMWDNIAYRELGSESHTGKLMMANTKYVGYFYFPAGIVLTLPDIDTEVSSVSPPWKQVSG